jgi:HSP20 family molecular chaperone IbpA
MSAQVTVRDTNGSSPAAPRAHRTVAPAVDVFENADEILVIADVPGAPGDAIDVRVENDTLTIATHRPAAPESRALGREYEEFDFTRTFRLPRGIDGGNVRAESRDGTLIVRLPKAAAAKPRKIPVSAS